MEDYETAFGFGARAVVNTIKAVRPHMRQAGGGRIVNVVGAAARNPTPGYLTGGIANSGLINFSKGLADLGAPSNILVTAVSPAATATARWESLIAQQAASAGKTVDEQRAEAAPRTFSSPSRRC